MPSLPPPLKLSSSLWVCAAALVSLSLPGPSSGQTGSAQIQRSPAFRGAELKALPRNGWLTNGGNVYNQRYSPLTQINRDNVANLKPSWRVSLNGSGTASKYSGQGQPLVYEGVIYMVTGADDVFAVSVETGQILWTYEAKLDDSINVVCCGWLSRGLGMGDGKVYVGQLDGKLVALDQRTRRCSLVDASGALAGRVLDHGGAALLRRARDHGIRRRRPRVARPPQGIRREAPASSSGRSTRSRAPASSATTRGRKTMTLGNTAARRFGKRPRWIPSSA